MRPWGYFMSPRLEQFEFETPALVELDQSIVVYPLPVVNQPLCT